MTTIADIMTRSIATVRRDETLQAAAQRMQEMDVGSLPVLDGQAVAGVVTDRDIAVRGVAAGMIPQESLVADVMTRRAPLLPRRRHGRAGDGRDGRPAAAAPSRPRRAERNRRHRFPRRPRHATIGAHRRNSARDLDARSLNSKSPNALQRYLLERLIGPAAQHVLRHPGAFALQTLKALQGQPGPAARRRGGVLRAAVDRAAADPDRDRAVAADRPGASCWPRSAATSSGWCRASRGAIVARARQLPRAPRRARLAAARHDALLQLARLHGARERDVGDLPAPRRDPAAPLPVLGAAAVLLHPLPRRRPAAGDAGRRQPAGDGRGERRAVRPRVVAERRVRACCSTCSASPARSSC